MSETDPWKVAKSTIRARIADYSVALLGHSSGSQQAKENAQTAIDVAIDAARAAEAAQHQQEKDTLRTMATRLTCWRCGTAAYQPNERCDSHMSWTDRLQTEVEHHNAWRKRADEAEAERDRLKAALQDAVYTIAGWRTGSIGSIGNVHVGSFDVEHLARLRAVLTPQGQSTDGETR